MSKKHIYVLIIGIIWGLLATFIIALTPPNVALESDAQGYYDEARQSITNHTVFSQWVSPSTHFGDYGYTFVVALTMLATGSSNVVILQLTNYLFWLLAVYFIYRSLKVLNLSTLSSIFMLFSPAFLTFTGKLYSESYAALGLSILIYSFIKGNKYWLYILGGFILISTKSSFLPLLLIPFLASLYLRNYRLVLLTCLIPILTLSNFLGVQNRERSQLVLAIQTAKLSWSYDTIASCTLYYVSYPLGVAIAPSYQGACHPNNPTLTMPMVDQNPYGLGAKAVSTGHYNFLNSVLSSPLKYITLMVSNLGTILWFEGIYPSIILQLPPIIWLPLYLIFKIFISLYIWFKIISYANLLRKQSLLATLLYLSPIIFFVLVYGNFHEEQRYFYPLFPYMYFALGLSSAGPKKLISLFDRVYTDRSGKQIQLISK